MCGRGSRKRFKGKDGEDIDDGFGKWGGYMAAKAAKLIDQFHSDNTEKLSDIFSGVRILVNGLTHPPAAELKNLMAAHGGEYHMYQSSATTHIIASNLPNVKIKHLGAVPIVKPAWITESIALNKLLDYKRYLLYNNQSRLQPALNFPVVAKSPATECPGEKIVLDFPQFNDEKINKENTEEDGNIDHKNSSIQSIKTHIPSSSSTNSRVTKTASDPKFLEEFYSNSRLHLIATLGAEFKQLVCQLREKSDGKFPGREGLIAQKGKHNSNQNLPSCVVMHIDMDCFFVSVGLRNHPELRGEPVAITHAKNGVIKSTDPTRQAIRDQEFALYEERLSEGTTSRVVDIKQKIDGLASMSEIASCSYEARKYGITNGMFLGQAVKLCAGLKTLPYDFEGYKEVSNMLYKTVASYTLDIEAVSCDEMYVDIKQILADTGLTVEEWATHIRKEIMTITGCPCSTGFGANRLQARLATRKAKPAGQYYLKPEEVETYMSEISLADVPGVGRATLAKLRHLGYNTCGDLQNGSLKILQSELGNKVGERIWEQAHGKDNKPLDFNHERKSVSAEINYGIRFKTKDEYYNFLQSLAHEVFNRLSDVNMKARGLTLKLLARAEGAPVETAKFLGHGVCDAITKSSTTNLIFSSADIIYKEAKSIYDKLNVPFAELRGVGIQLTKLEKNAPVNKALSNFLKRGTVKRNAPSSLDRRETTIIQPSTDAKTMENRTLEVEEKIYLTDIEMPENTSIKQLRSSSNTTKTIVKDTIPSTKSRGRGRRGKKLSTNRTMKTFLERPKNTTNLNQDGQNQSISTVREQIDLDVLNELPESIRNEIMEEYNISIKVNPLRRTMTETIVESKSAVTTTVVAKSSPFANQTWEQIKQGIKIWIRCEQEPSVVDVEMLADHLRQLALDRRIEILKSCFNFLHRTFSDLNCAWHQAYYSLVDALQQGMVASYGKILHIDDNFTCCSIA